MKQKTALRNNTNFIKKKETNLQTERALSRTGRKKATDIEAHTD